MHKRARMKLGVMFAMALAGSASGLTYAAVPSIAPVVQGTAHQALFAVAFEGQIGHAVGAAGEVQTTEDGGKTWKQTRLPTDMALLGIHMDAQRSIAVGQVGTMFRKAADGSWEKIDSGTEKRLFNVDANSSGLVVAVGEFGTIVLSQDGGSSWHTLSLDWMQLGTDGGAEPHLYDVSISEEGRVTVVGEFGMVLRSDDQGRSWSVKSRGAASLFAIQIRDDGKGYAVGQDGYVLKTDDRGDTWTCLDTGRKSIFTGIHSTPDGHVTLMAMRDMVTSEDGGATWTPVENPEVTTLWYVSVASPGDVLYAVGQSGRIIKIGG